MPFTLHPTFPASGGPHQLTDQPITMLHRHNCFEIGYCHSGAGIFVVEDKTLPFRQGDVSVISEAEMHLAQSAAGTVSQWTFINLDPLALVPAAPEERWLLRTEPFHGGSFRNIFTPEAHPAIVAPVRTIIEEMLARSPGYQPAVRAQAWTLLLALHRLAGTVAEPWTGEVADSRIAPIARALEMVATQYAQPLRVEEMAAACHCSATHFRRLFTAAVGQSPQQYLTQFRLRMATTLLAHTEQSVAEIAGAVGYPTLSSFNRQFKALLGVSPRGWRRGRG